MNQIDCDNSLDSSQRHIARNFLLLSAGLVLANLAMFGSNALLGRFWGPHEYSKFAFIMSVVNTTTMLADNGLSMALTKRLAEALGKQLGDAEIKLLVRKFQRTIYINAAVGSVCAGFIILIFTYSLGELFDIAKGCIGFWVFVPVVAASVIAVFNAFESMSYSFVLYSLQEPVKFLVVIALWILGDLTFDSLAIFWTVIYLLDLIVASGLINRFLTRRLGVMPKISWRKGLLWSQWQEGLLYFLPTYGRIILPSIVVIILGIVSIENEVSWFAASASLTAFTFLILQPLTNTLFPTLTNRYARTGEVMTPANGERLLYVLFLGSLGILLVFYGVRSWALELTYGVEFIPAEGVVIILALANFFEAMRIGGDLLLNSMGLVDIVSLLELVRYIILIPAVFVLGKLYGAMGAAVTVLFTSAASSAVRLILVERRLKIHTSAMILMTLALGGGVFYCWSAHVSSRYVILLALVLTVGFGKFSQMDWRLFKSGVTGKHGSEK